MIPPNYTGTNLDIYSNLTELYIKGKFVGLYPDEESARQALQRSLHDIPQIALAPRI